MLISFIIPTYNQDKYLRRCLNSVFACERADFEVIVINDGSTDKTEVILEEFKCCYESLTIMHTKNFGQGAARNRGLDMATGEFVMFCDSDDEVIANTVFEMARFAKTNNFDVVMAPYYRWTKLGKELIKPNITEGEISRFSSEKSARERFRKIKDKNIFGYLVTKVYRRDFIERFEVRFDEDSEVFMEDSVFNHKLMSFAPRYYYMGTASYIVEARNISYTRAFTKGIATKSIRTIERYCDYLSDRAIFGKSLDLVSLLAFRVFAYSLIKNTAYEGRSLKLLLRRCDLYFKSKAYKKLTEHRGVFRELMRANSLPERLLYAFCFLAIKFRQKHIIAMFFYLAQPLFLKYIHNNVK